MGVASAMVIRENFTPRKSVWTESVKISPLENYPLYGSWYSGDEALTKTYPACRAERGYNYTMLLWGLDDFLKKVRQAIQTEDERDEEELPLVSLA